MSRSRRSPVELASDIGAKAFDLHAYGNVAALRALAIVARVNPDVLAWLRDRLLDLTVQPGKPSIVDYLQPRAEPETPGEGGGKSL